MIESCSGGGGRFDIGMMQYSTQIWTSDNTWPHHRAKIQYGTSFAYPASVMSCHISNPQNICADPDNMHLRFCTSLAGPLGYEMHLPNASQEIREEIQKQITFYRSVEHIILNGNLHRILSPVNTPYSAYYFITDDQSEVLLSFLEIAPDVPKKVKLKCTAVKKNKLYMDAATGEQISGSCLHEGILHETSGSGNRGWIKHFLEIKQ